MNCHYYFVLTKEKIVSENAHVNERPIVHKNFSDDIVNFGYLFKIVHQKLISKFDRGYKF